MLYNKETKMTMDSTRAKLLYTKNRIKNKTVEPGIAIKVYNKSLKRILLRKRIERFIDTLRKIKEKICSVQKT